jgi:hypothetical protein
LRSVRHPDGTRVEAIIDAAERRRLLVLAVEQAAIGVVLVLTGGILMLLLGTQILNWYWLVLLAVAGIGIVLLRMRSRPLARYRLAQILDRRLQLSDSLSTACFLLSRSRKDDPVARFQLARADEIARSVQPSRAFPFSGRRQWALSAALAMLAFGLFAVRYLVTRSLSLEQALVPIHFGPMFEAVEQTFSGERSHRAGDFSPDARRELAPSAHSQQREDSKRAALPEETKAGNPAGAAPGTATAQNSSSQPEATEPSNGRSPNGQPGQNDPQSQPNGDEKSGRDSTGAQQQQQTAAQSGSSGVLDKMKDALSSLMAKMRSSSSPEGPARGFEQTALGREQRGSQQSERSEQASRQQSTEGQAQGQSTEKAQAAQGRNSDSGDRKSSDSQSGAGRQDGDKAIKEAEQQRAMGKLAEIIGKRSANLTGDMTVETASGNQQLKTEYSQRMGRHADLGGEINRNEIPVIYQQTAATIAVARLVRDSLTRTLALRPPASAPCMCGLGYAGPITRGTYILPADGRVTLCEAFLDRAGPMF